MNFDLLTENKNQIPQGYAAIPLDQEQKNATLKICILVKQQPDPVAGHLVVLRENFDAKILLGCILDAGSGVRQWIELWVQNVEPPSSTSTLPRQFLTNAALDNRWKNMCRSFEQLDHTGIINTGWDQSHQRPMFLDLNTLEPLHLRDEQSGCYWRLCEDDALLAKKELPEYKNSLHRYLYLPELAPDSPLVPVTADAPTNQFTEDYQKISPENDNIIPFNLSVGFILVRLRGLTELEPFIDLLSGGSWEGIRHGRSTIELQESQESLSPDRTDSNSIGRLFLAPQGRWGRLAETFHLKLCLLAELISSVHTMTSHQQRPFLNLSPSAFQISLGQTGRDLPFLWTARAMLTEPGGAIAMPIKTSETQYFLPAYKSTTSIYHTTAAGPTLQGRADVRIRKVLPQAKENTIIEGTLTTQEKIQIAMNDLIWLRLNLATGPMELYAHLEEETALASGEWRFRTVELHLNSEARNSLEAAEGVPMSDTWFEIVPLLSTPCDLYSLAVIFVRTLLVDQDTTLPIALDEILSLARQVSLEYDESVKLELRIQKIFQDDNRWIESLGPHRLVIEEISPQDALDVITIDLWRRILAMLTRMFPGIGPDSFCRDYGDAVPGGLHKVFDSFMCDLDNLILRSRSLIVTDCKFNQEIASVIQKQLLKVTGATEND